MKKKKERNKSPNHILVVKKTKNPTAQTIFFRSYITTSSIFFQTDQESQLSEQLLQLHKKFVHPCFWFAWLIVQENLSCKRPQKLQSFNPFRGGYWSCIRGDYWTQLIIVKKKTNKKPETSIFRLIWSSVSVFTNDSPIYCFLQWPTVDAQGRSLEDNKHHQKTNTQQYYPGTPSQLPDTTGATPVAYFSSIQTR